MRVAIAAESFLPRVNGVVNSVVHVARHLHNRGIPVVIVAPDSYDSDNFEGIPVERVKSVAVPGVHDYDVSVASAGRCARIVRDFEPTVVHLASPFVLGSRMQTAAHQAGVPTVAVFQTDVAGFASHYGFSSFAFLADAVVRRIHANADVNLVPSSACEAYLNGLGVRDSRIWGRGVDLQVFDPRHRSGMLRSSWGARERLVVGFVGRLAPEKNVHILSRLAARRDVQLVIIGDGPSRADLERLLPDARFTGRLVGAPLGAAMASMDVLVAPGENETFCQVVQEGMASGVAVVAPAIGGPLDLIDDGVTGLLYPPGDPQAMADAVLGLGADPDLRFALIGAALPRVRRRSWSTLGDELIGHYASVSDFDSILEAA